MAEIIRMPRLSDTMEEGVIIEWHKKVGDKINPGDILAEVETDKATMDLESFDEGVLLYIGIEEGTVPVDGIIAVIGKEGEDYQELLANAESGSDNGSNQKEDVAETGEEQVVSQEGSGDLQASTDTSESGGRIKASPLARKMAKDSGINLNLVKGTGEGGRIVKKDIEKAKEKGITSQPSIQSPVSTGPDFRDVPLSQMRKTIAKRLAASKFGAPHFYLTMEIDMGPSIVARKAINESIAPDKISFNDLVIKAASLALRQHPAINASWLEDKIRYNNRIHIGVAVAVDDGLVVPVIQNADLKGLSSLNKEVKDYATRARSKELKLEEMQGNTFTISNLGMFGIEEFTAIINPPDSCILAVGGIVEKPVVENGQIKPGHRMKVTMSCDHRVVDGATGAKFLQTFKDLLEQPVRMLA